MVKNLITEEFKNQVFDFEKNEKWVYNGVKPCIIDFYATWCGPCKTLSPILEDIKNMYGDKIEVYKIDVDNEHTLAGMFEIRSIPSILFVPMSGEPSMSVGLLNKDQIIDIVDKNLLK